MSENTEETPAKSINAFTAFENYDNFKGEAGHTEFWSFFALVHVVVLLLMIPAIPVFFRETGDGIVTENNWHASLTLSLPVIIWGLLVVIPLCSLLVRRLNNSPYGSYVFGLLTIMPALLCIYCNRYLETSFVWTLFWFYEFLFVLVGCLPGNAKPAEEVAEEVTAVAPVETKS